MPIAASAEDNKTDKSPLDVRDILEFANTVNELISCEGIMRCEDPAAVAARLAYQK